MPTMPTTPSAPALPLAWWTVDGGFAPALEPVSSADLAPALRSGDAARVWLVGVADGGASEADRERARQAIRAAVRAALGALLGVPPAAIDLPAGPGEAPYALVPDPAAPDAAPRRIALAISHDEALSVAAIRLDGPIGIDVMRSADIPDWAALARDYLGPDAARDLAGLDAAARPLALARAWSEREARLKCMGLGLSEWRADEVPLLAACICLPLALPDGYVGCLALAPGRTT